MPRRTPAWAWGHAVARACHRRAALLLGIAALLALSPLSRIASATVDSELAFHRGVSAFGQGDYEAAQREFEAVLAEDDRDSAALHYLGLIDQARGDEAAAVQKFSHAVEVEPENSEARMELAVALLALGRRVEAMRQLSRVLELEPERAEAHLYLGIAHYRERQYASAVKRLEQALALDSGLELEASYYLGLAQAFSGNLGASTGAFGVAEQTEPLHPLGRSAASLRQQIATRTRTWSLSLSGGLEYDSNIALTGAAADERDDGRGIVRLRADVRAMEGERGTLDFGYDGYLGLYFTEGLFSQQTHLLWTAGSYQVGAVRLSGRYDYSFTTLDLGDSFRHLHRLTPGAAMPTGDWGVAQVYYQFQYFDYLQTVSDPSFRRDGPHHSAGVNQFVFLPAPLTHARAGVRGLFFDPKGDEFAFKGFELSGGGGLELPWEAQLELLYVFHLRNYDHKSAFGVGKRRDRSHWLNLECALPLATGLEVSVAAAFIFNGSNIGDFDYNRQIVGSYLTYRF